MENDTLRAPIKAVLVFIFGVFLIVGVGFLQNGGRFFQSPQLAGFQSIALNSFEDFDQFFSNNGFSVKAWRSGTQLVPRIIIMDIPEAWGKEIAPNLNVEKKKSAFFSLAVPLVLTANEEIQQDRKMLFSVSVGQRDKASERWLMAQAKKYKVEDFLNEKELVERLKKRMDMIPVSIAVAQMAEESGWGTSRFAAEGNALFGQWSYKGGMKPLGQRSGKGDYRIQSFDSPLESVRAYMLNLNSNKAYSDFRQERENLRNSSGNVWGGSLVEFLTSYSERGEKYIKGLKFIISVNELSAFDTAQLEVKSGFYLTLGN